MSSVVLDVASLSHPRRGNAVANRDQTLLEILLMQEQPLLSRWSPVTHS